MKGKRLMSAGVILLGTAAVCLLVAGCGNQEKPEWAKNRKSSSSAKAHDHSDWWCAEHGIPEEECALCNDKVADKCKAAGDWCKEHDRPKSQCFKCDPKLKEKFAARYRAKYGKEPPPLEDKE